MAEDKRAFFKEEVFHILAKELWKRYYQKQDFGVSIGMKLFEGVDTTPLRSLMGISPLDWTRMKRISLVKFEVALKTSIFSWELTEFVVFTSKKQLTVKAEVEAEEQRKFQDFCTRLERIDSLFLSKLSEKQLRALQANNFDLQSFQHVSNALKNLPTDYIRMPVFSYQQTGNPHTFDESQPAGQLLLQMLSALSASTDGMPLARTEVKHQLLAEFHLLRDDIMNDVAVRGLESLKGEQLNQMWRHACLQGCTWNVPLKEILRMDKNNPTVGNKVLVVENSGVYSILVEMMPNVPIICSSGQFTYAVWQLLRKLIQSNSYIYYVGDLDPEGILMAHRLLQMFPNNVRTVGMNLENYRLAARPSAVSQTRLKQLRIVNEPSLKVIVDCIIETGEVAYQEGFINELIQEVLQKPDVAN